MTGVEAGARGRRAALVVVGAAALVAVVLGAAAWTIGWVPRSSTAPAQVTGYSVSSATTLTVAFVRGTDASLTRAYADETVDQVVVHVVVTTPGRWWWQSSTADGVYDSTTIALSSPLGSRTVVDDNGDAVVHQPPGVIPAPRSSQS